MTVDLNLVRNLGSVSQYWVEARQNKWTLVPKNNLLLKKKKKEEREGEII